LNGAEELARRPGYERGMYVQRFSKVNGGDLTAYALVAVRST
jgi:hypothetical protein